MIGICFIDELSILMDSLMSTEEKGGVVCDKAAFYLCGVFDSFLSMWCV